MTIAEKDSRYVWHPYTHQADRAPAIPVVKGKGALLYDADGNHYIDAVSSWWVNIHGHGNTFIAKKIYQQAKRLEQVIFTTFTHEPAVSLAEQLLPLLPGNFARVFYSDDGSTATEVAIKMALQYWRNRGESRRNKIIAFQHAYHGDTFGAMSISERGTFTMAFRDKLFEVVFIETPREDNIFLAQSLIRQHADEIACFIYEPLLQGAGGMKMHDPHHLDTLLSLMKDEGILCIADEVLTGFYRTGRLFAGDYLEQKADIICLSKALTGGTMALGVTACTQQVHDAFLTADRTKTFFHGHSFTANPLACTAALASLELTLRPECAKQVAYLVEWHALFLGKLRRFERKGFISNLRQTGTICAFDFNTGNYDYLHNIGSALTGYGMKRGVYIRALGNTVYVMPPYCITRAQMRKVYRTIESFIRLTVSRGQEDSRDKSSGK